MHKLSVTMLALSAAVATSSLAGVAQARDDHRGDGYRHSEHSKHRHHHRHRHGHRGPSIRLGIGDGYYDDGVSIRLGDRRHRHDRYYD